MRICFTGMTCSGKSYISKHLSEKISYYYLDLDRELSILIENKMSNGLLDDFLIENSNIIDKKRLSKDYDLLIKFNNIFKFDLVFLINEKCKEFGDNFIISFTKVREFGFDEIGIFDKIYEVYSLKENRKRRYYEKYGIPKNLSIFDINMLFDYEMENHIKHFDYIVNNSTNKLSDILLKIENDIKLTTMKTI